MVDVEKKSSRESPKSIVMHEPRSIGVVLRGLHEIKVQVQGMSIVLALTSSGLLSTDS